MLFSSGEVRILVLKQSDLEAQGGTSDVVMGEMHELGQAPIKHQAADLPVRDFVFSWSRRILEHQVSWGTAQGSSWPQ